IELNIYYTPSEKLSSALTPTVLELIDKSCGCGTSFDALIVSNNFTDKRLLDRHRLVNNIIKEELPKIHAFSMKCHTPEQSL
uniref:BolA-like protein n=1 Tax=Piliocolobus tephrosceles TaxID=591936 RepID=A0A8C9GMW2_9PRIM